MSMGAVRRALASVLLAAGIVLVFAGLSTALGFTPGGMLASVAAIAALLYAGGIWFGGSAAAQLSAPGATVVIVFDRLLNVVSGPAPGTSLLLQFPAALRPELETRCRMALRGERTHFSCEHAGATICFDISAVHAVDGVIAYGIIVAGQGQPLPAVAPAPVTTVA